MKIFLLICLASGLASSEKLDRSYLPPPGSKFSGGSPGDIQVPLEFPKETYSTGRPQLVDGKPDIELGINRRPSSQGVPDNQKPVFTNFQNSYVVPKTTTSYAITQTTTFAPVEDYDGVDQPASFINGSTRIQPGLQGQIDQQQPIRGPGQVPIYNQYRPEQPSTITPYGTTSRPLFPGTQKGLEYLPPAPSSGNRGQATSQVVSSQDGFGYPSGQPQGPKYQDGISGSTVNLPGYVYPGASQQNQYSGNQNIPSSTAAPQYQDGRFGPTGPGSQQAQNQFSGSPVPPQYQNGERFNVPGSNKQNQFLGNQDFPSSTAAPEFQTGQRFTTPGLNQQEFGSRVPNQQDQYTRNQYQENQIFPSSTSAPTPGSVQHSQFFENQYVPSTSLPNGQRLTTPGFQGGIVPDQQTFGSRIPNQQGQDQYTGNQNIPSTTTAPQFQNGERFSSPGYVQSSVPTQQNQNQYIGNQNIPSSTTAPQYESSQQFTTPGPIRQNQYPGNQDFASTAAPTYQNGQRLTTPGQYQGEHLSNQQRFGSRIPSQQSQSQYNGDQNFPSSTATPQYQDSQRFTTPEQQQRFDSSQSNQQNQYTGSQSIPSWTTAPQYQDQRFTSPGQQGPLLNQPYYPGSTAAPQYQQTVASTPGINQQGVIPNQQNQYKRPGYNQQIPSSTSAPSRFIPGSQSYANDAIQTTPGTAVSFPESQSGFTGSQSVSTYGNTLQPTSQTGAGSPVYGTTPSVPSRFSNQGFSSTTVGPLPARDYSLTPGNVAESRPERPQAEDDRNAEILNYENILTPEGYYYSYDTSNGIHADETGTVGNGTRAQGGFSYTGDDGIVYSVFYSADENGFQPRGDHLPTPPPIPEAIQRVIDQANKDKESGIDDDGSYNEEKYGYMKYEGPLTRLRPQNRIVPTVNGADIPDRTESRVGGLNKKVYKPKGTKVNTERYTETDSDAEFESEPESNKTDVTDEIQSGDDNFDGNKETKTRISTKRPNPINDLTVEDSGANKLKGNKMPMKSTINSKIYSSQTSIDRNGSIRRPVSSENDEKLATDYISDTDISEKPEDNDDLRPSQGIDYDSDLINYKDDPNNRTDFRGLNKYLPKPKGTSKKNQSSKKRPTTQIDGTRRLVAGVTKSEQPGDRDGQALQGDVINEGHTRIPSRKNKFGQKIIDHSKTTAQPVTFDSDDVTNTDDSAGANEKYDSGNKTGPVANNGMELPGTQPNKKIFGKPKRPVANERTGISVNQGQLSSDTETGYEYNPPQRKFDSEGAIKLPSRTFSQKGTQTTLRPFMTKNVYGDDNEPTEEDIDQYGAVKPGRPGRPGRPMFSQKQQYPGFKQENDRYNENPNPEVNEYVSFTSTGKPVAPYGTTSSRRPFGRPQTTAIPQYEGESVTDENRYNEPSGIQGPQRPGDEIYYNTNAPNRGTSKTGNIFSSTTPLPPTSDSFKYRPGQYQDKSTDGSAYYDETTSPRGEIPRPGYPSVSAQVPSTTYRPSYSFGDRTSAPSGSITVDGFGRPITSTIAPSFEATIRPTYSTVRPSANEDLGNRPSQKDHFRPADRRFGVTSTPQGSGYQGSTSAPIGEDFSGPKQPQKFDPNSGYYYK